MSKNDQKQKENTTLEDLQQVWPRGVFIVESDSYKLLNGQTLKDKQAKDRKDYKGNVCMSYRSKHEKCPVLKMTEEMWIKAMMRHQFNHEIVYNNGMW